MVNHRLELWMLEEQQLLHFSKYSTEYKTAFPVKIKKKSYDKDETYSDILIFIPHRMLTKSIKAVLDKLIRYFLHRKR